MGLETEFTPFAALIGGALIGLSAVALMGVAGRVFGATGIITGAIYGDNGTDREWRLALLAGMVVAPFVYFLLAGGMPEVTVPVSRPMVLIGGFIVGIGVYFGSGCTSGHGVCGLARLSPRSLVAVPVFMVATIITVFLIRHVFGG